MLRSLVAALALTFVTATVTPAQLAAPYFVTITNLDTGHQMIWRQRNYPGQQTCDAALGNLSEQLAALVIPDAKVPDSVNIDPDLESSVLALVMQVWSNTGKMPRFGISCETTGDPA